MLVLCILLVLGTLLMDRRLMYRMHRMVTVISGCLLVRQLLIRLLSILLLLLVLSVVLLWLLLFLGVQFWVGGHLRESLTQSLRHGWGSGQMITSGTESVLIGDVMDGNDMSVLVSVGVESLGHLDLMVLLSSVLHVALLVLVNAVGCLELVLVGAVLRLNTLALQDRDVLVLLGLLHVLDMLRWLLVVVHMLLHGLLDHWRVLLWLVMVLVLHFSRVVLLLGVIIHLGCGHNRDQHGQRCNELRGVKC